MGLQEMKCSHSALFVMGINRLLQSIQRLQTNINILFPDLYTDPITDWVQINQIFDMFGGNVCMINAGMSKDEEQGDGSKGIFQMSINQGVLVKIFELSRDAGLLKDANSCEIDYSVYTNRENLQKWMAIVRSYEGLVEIMEEIFTIAYTIAPYYKSGGVINRSPAQLSIFDSYLLSTSTTANDKTSGIDCASYSNLSRIPWNTIDTIYGSIINVLMGEYWEELYSLSLPDVEFTDSSMYFSAIGSANLVENPNYYTLPKMDVFSIDSITYVEPLSGSPNDPPDEADLFECYGGYYQSSFLAGVDTTVGLINGELLINDPYSTKLVGLSGTSGIFVTNMVTPIPNGTVLTGSKSSVSITLNSEPSIWCPDCEFSIGCNNADGGSASIFTLHNDLPNRLFINKNNCLTHTGETSGGVKINYKAYTII